MLEIYIPKNPPSAYTSYIKKSYNQCGKVYGSSCQENGSSLKFPIPFCDMYSPTFIV